MRFKKLAVFALMLVLSLGFGTLGGCSDGPGEPPEELEDIPPEEV